MNILKIELAGMSVYAFSPSKTQPWFSVTRCGNGGGKGSTTYGMYDLGAEDAADAYRQAARLCAEWLGY